MTVALQPIKAAEISLGKLFTDDFDFVIPEYQRPYAWGTEETLQLLSDLQSALDRDTEEPYFLGSVVLIKEATSPRSEVIDGQQRLTTLTILLAVLRDLVIDDELQRAIHKLLEEPAVLFEDRDAAPRLTLRPRDSAFFREHIQTKGATMKLVTVSDNLTTTDSQRAIRDNAAVLRKELLKWGQPELLQLYKMLGKRTFVVTVSTPDLNSAYRIFSVMNARGLPLSPPDIFKSQVIGAIPEHDRDHHANAWEQLEQELGRREFGELFLYIRAITSQTRAVRGLLQEFREQVLDDYLPSNGKGFIREVLEPYARADNRLLSQDFQGAGAWPSVNSWLKRLSQLDNDDWRPVALWALRHHGDDAEYLSQFMCQLERLAASMLLRRVYATPRVQRYMELLKQLVDGQGLTSPAFELSSSERQETLARLGDEIYTVRRVRKYILLRLDSMLASDAGATYDHSIITVEHVLPQNPDESSQWLQDFSEEEWLHWRHRLGNLLLLNRRKNSQAQNYDFDRKKSAYFSSRAGVSSFALTTQVLKEPQWTPDVVERRHRELLGLLAREWNLSTDFPS